MTVIQTTGGAPMPMATDDKTVDECFFAAILNKLEGWLANNQPSEELRRVLLRTSQTAFAAIAEAQS